MHDGRRDARPTNNRDAVQLWHECSVKNNFKGSFALENYESNIADLFCSNARDWIYPECLRATHFSHIVPRTIRRWSWKLATDSVDRRNDQGWRYRCIDRILKRLLPNEDFPASAFAADGFCPRRDAGDGQ